MKCPQCHTTQTAKNGHRRGRQCYKSCNVVASSSNPTVLGATRTISSNCASKCIWTAWVCAAPLRVTQIHHTTVMHWVREAGHQLHDAPESEQIPEVPDRRCTANLRRQQVPQTLDLDSSQSPPSWNFGMGDWWSQCSNLPAVVEYRQMQSTVSSMSLMAGRCIQCSFSRATK